MSSPAVAPEYPATVERLRSATAAMSRLVTASRSGTLSADSIREIAFVFAAVQNVQKSISELQKYSDGRNAKPLQDYASALRDWYEELPRLKGWLLTEKSRLQARHSQASAVRAWLQAHEETR